MTNESMGDQNVVEVQSEFEGEPVTIKVGTLPEGLNQASGVTPLEGLDDDIVLLIGDKDLTLAQIVKSERCFNDEVFVDCVTPLDLQGKVDVNDMEDITWDAERRMAFVVVSGSKNSKNELKPKREKLVRLTYHPETRTFSGEEKAAFKSDVVAAFPELAPAVASHVNNGGVQGTFNIEGATLVPGGNLLLGFRSPTHPRDAANPIEPGDAIVIALNNPHEVFDKKATPRFDATPRYLDLGGQGIRAMFYDDERAGCWLVSGASANAVVVDAEPWRLWFWDLENQPIQKTINTDVLKNAEGICRMKLGGQAGLLLVEDAGKDASDNPLRCRYALVPLPE